MFRGKFEKVIKFFAFLLITSLVYFRGKFEKVIKFFAFLLITSLVYLQKEEVKKSS